MSEEFDPTIPVRNEDHQRVRELNDVLRTTFKGGTVVITTGIQALTEPDRQRIYRAIQQCSEFPEEADPFEEHDLTVVRVVLSNGEETVVWGKIDYYDKNLEFGSPDSSDSSVTHRVLTIMYPHER